MNLSPDADKLTYKFTKTTTNIIDDSSVEKDEEDKISETKISSSLEIDDKHSNGCSISTTKLDDSNRSTLEKLSYQQQTQSSKQHTSAYLSQIDANRIRLELAKVMILQKLPDDNYKLLKFIFKFLCQIIDRKDLNKMTSSNLAIVFGPNLLWSKDKCASLASISAIIYFTEFLLDNFSSIFVK